MRIDKFLKVSRILKRRTVAASACDGDRVFVNEKLAKPSTRLKVGDHVRVEFAAAALSFKVLRIDEKASKEEASTFYEVE